MPFEKGKSGNPAGRPKGIGLSAELRKAIEANAESIINAMVKAAQEGDTAAGKALLDRVLPALKQQQQAATVKGGETLSGKGAAIVDAMNRGEITADVAQSMLAALASLSKVIEVDELERRLTELEKQDHDN